MKLNSLESKKQGILEALRKGKVHLQFKKVNGDLRNMVGTLQEDFIPVSDIPTKDNDRSENKVSGIVVLYDLEVKGWRSFRVENLIEYRCDLPW